MKIEFSPYKIKRDHSNKTEFFIVNVEEAKQYGIGFQFRKGEYVKGASVSVIRK